MARRQKFALNVSQLEERCTPAAGLEATLNAPVIVQISDFSAQVAPSMQSSAPTVPEPAKPIIRTDLFCAGMPSFDPETSLADQSADASDLSDEVNVQTANGEVEVAFVDG